jgi:peptidoglycan/LPS O-acetylase OafA/YrhL
MPPRDGHGRLEFLDGLRGLSCFYVLLFHVATLKLEGHGDPSTPARIVLAWLNEGRLAVVFFIVLSGFSLMLPVARANTSGLAGGFGRFMRRRARRILPPYYAALVLSMAVIVSYNALAVRFGLGQRIDDAALEPGSIVSHLLLIHNVSFDWVYRINGPLWSVATEWQIYWVFALAMLPLRRFVGDAWTVVLAWVVGALPFFLLPPNENYFWACPWFIGSFALGMWGAAIGFSPAYQDAWLRTRAPWALLSLLFFAVTVALFGSRASEQLGYPITDLVVSLLAFCLINACVQRSVARRESSRMLRILGARSLVYLGGFSYSLYLVQHPLIRFTEKIFSRLPFSYDVVLALHLLLATPLVMAAAWVFAEFFEKPFTTGSLLIPALRRVVGLAPSPAANSPLPPPS